MNSDLNTLIFYPRSIALFSSGVFSGLGVSMNYVSVPSIKASKDSLPVFLQTYSKGKNIAILNILISTIANGVCYYRTKDKKFILTAALSFASMPWTLLFMAPVNNQLFALEKTGEEYDRKKVDTLVTKWNRLQYFRTVTGTAAFVINLLY
ncbi:hypothetical protein K501DRAFT_284992 [Backusella circina FSU 941]|nr:hypothetical protein K501DRAFT_284992 [Backusella circina FSU 941]